MLRVASLFALAAGVSHTFPRFARQYSRVEVFATGCRSLRTTCFLAITPLARRAAASLSRLSQTISVRAPLDPGNARPKPTLYLYWYWPGCISPPGQKNPISYTWSCVNSTSALVNYHEGSTCAGPVVHAAPLSVDSHCAGSASGGSSQTICAFGDYHPSQDTVNVNIFANSKNACPVNPGLRPSAFVELEYEHCFSDSTSSYWYACSPTDVTGVSFESADCSGTPHPTPVIPLGCFANASNPSGAPQFTTCPRHDSKSGAAQLRGAAAVTPASPSLHVRALAAAVDAAVVLEVARARELVAAARM